MQYSVNMPSQVQRTPRNVTGIFLGLEGSKSPAKSRTGIPPLARGRGFSCKVRTPVEERRYESAVHIEKKQMVELMRIKEEKKGFVGQPLKKKAVNGEKRPCTSSPNVSPRRWGPAKRANTSKFSDRIKTNPRHYTPVINSGVTRSENLTGFTSYTSSPDIVRNIMTDQMVDISRLHLTDNLSDNLNRMGLVQQMESDSDTYRRLYQTDIEAAYNLLPRNNPPVRHKPQSTYATGFSVRSYRNPNQAEILANFPDPKSHLRPKTVPVNQVFVPQPYFFRYYNHHRSLHLVSAKSRTSGSQTEDDKDSIGRILGVPGTGSISQSLLRCQTNRRKHNSSPVELDSPCTFQKSDESNPVSVTIPTTSHQNTTHEPDLKPTATKRQGETTQNKQDSSTRSNQSTGSETDRSMAEVATTEVRRDSQLLLFPEEARKMRPLKTSNSGADITLGLEDVDGATAEVEIDVNDDTEIAPEDIPRGKVRKASIVEKLSKSKASEAYVATVKESAEQRQKDFEKLLNEHAEIVQEIGRTASAENLNSDERDP